MIQQTYNMQQTIYKYNIQYTRITYSYILYMLYILYTLYSILYTLYSIRWTLDSTLYTLHSTLYTIRSYTLYSIYSMLCTLYFNCVWGGARLQLLPCTTGCLQGGVRDPAWSGHDLTQQIHHLLQLASAAASSQLI